MDLSGTTFFKDAAGLDDDEPPPPARRFWMDFWRGPRQPCVGLALAAAGGILTADALAFDPWKALGGFLLLALGYIYRPRPWVCWLVIAAAFGMLHLFRLHAIPSKTLARQLPTSPNEAAQLVRASGVVLDEPRLSASGSAWRFTFGLEHIEVNGLGWDCRAPVSASWQNGSPACGDRLEIIGAAHNIPAARNPGEFDFANYQRREGILSEIRFNGISDVRVPERNPVRWRCATQRFHNWMSGTLALGLEKNPVEGVIISTMLLGLKEKPGLGDMEELFQRTGTLHYFAIDGLKLALLSGLALWGLARCGLTRLRAGIIVLPMLLFYALATGLGPASLRAVLMAAALLGAYWLERPLRPLNSLGAAAALILLFDSHELFGLGFQLTFLVVLAIMVLAGPLHRWLMRFGAPDPFLPKKLYSWPRWVWERWRRMACGLVSVSLVAWLGSMPLMVIYFHVVSPNSPLANIAAFPLVWPLLALGVVALLGAGVFSVVGYVIPAAGKAAIAWASGINHCNALVAKLLLLTVQWFDAAPGGSFYVPAPAEWSIRRAPAAEICALDLGRARAIHLRAGGKDWLIDAGQESDYQFKVRPYLHYRGINRLEGLILSQADTYHLAAAPLALEEFLPSRIVDSSPLPGRSPRRKDFLQLLAGRGMKPEACPAGSRISLGPDAELRVFHPPPGLKSGKSDDRALVLQLRAAGWRVLLMADSGPNVERWLAQNVPVDELRSDAIVTGASPEKAASNPDFLRAAAPRLGVNTFGSGVRPRSTPMAVPEDSAIPMRRVEKSGAIRLRLCPDRMEALGFTDDSRTVIVR